MRPVPPDRRLFLHSTHIHTSFTSDYVSVKRQKENFGTHNIPRSGLFADQHPRDIFYPLFSVWFGRPTPPHEDGFTTSRSSLYPLRPCFLFQISHQTYPRCRWCSRPYSRRYGCSQTSDFSTDGSPLLHLFPGTSSTSVSPPPHRYPLWSFIHRSILHWRCPSITPLSFPRNRRKIYYFLATQIVPPTQPNTTHAFLTQKKKQFIKT